MSNIFADSCYGDNEYFAPKELYWNLQEEQRKTLSNGCGPGNWKIDLVPDSLMGCDFSISCDIHDIMYHYGIDEEDKRISDRTFLFNLLFDVDNHCKTNNILDRTERILLREAAFTYYRAVSDAGHSAFWEGKQDGFIRQG